MKTTKIKRTYDSETHKLVKEEKVKLDMVDAAGILLEEGQKVWYARASKSAPSELFQGKIIKLTPNSVTINYSDDTGWWWYKGCPESALARLTSGHYDLSKEDRVYKFKQIAVIQ